MQVDDTLDLFNELQLQHQAVATKTKTLHDACDRLVKLLLLLCRLLMFIPCLISVQIGLNLILLLILKGLIWAYVGHQDKLKIIKFAYLVASNYTKDPIKCYQSVNNSDCMSSDYPAAAFVGKT